MSHLCVLKNKETAAAPDLQEEHVITWVRAEIHGRFSSGDHLFPMLCVEVGGDVTDGNVCVLK